MTAYQCAKGCRDPAAKDGRMWHFNSNECPAETYNPKLSPGRPGKMRAKNHPGLPALPALRIWGIPVDGAVLWLIWKVRGTVGKSSKLMDVAPDLSEEEKTALAWSVKRTIRNEVKLYRAAKARGEA